MNKIRPWAPWRKIQRESTAKLAGRIAGYSDNLKCLSEQSINTGNTVTASELK